MGEKGPELVRLNGSEEVIPNRKIKLSLREAIIAPLHVSRSNIALSGLDRRDDAFDQV